MKAKVKAIVDGKETAGKKGETKPKKPGSHGRRARFLASEKLGNIIERISDGFVAFDTQMNYTYVNRKGGELLGRKPEDLVGKNYWVEFPEARGTPFAKAYQRALKTQTPIVLEDYYEPFDRWFENRIYPSKDGLAIFFTEITERKRAEDEIRLRVEQLAALNSIGRRVTSSLSVDEVAQSALDEIIRAVSPDLTMFFIRKDEKLLFHSSLSPNDSLLHKETPLHRVGECLCGLAVSEAQAIYSKNIGIDRRCTWKECREAGVVSFAAIPLLVNKNVLGVIGLASKTERDFNQTASFLETLSDQIAAGLQNARLYKDLQDRLNELTAIYETSQSLQKLLTPETLSQEIVELLEKTLSYEYGAVLLIEEPSGQLIPFAIVGRERGNEFIQKDKEYIASHGVAVGKGITGWVAEHGESVLIGDVQKDARYYGLRENIRSEMCVPLRAGDRVIGVVNVETTRPDAYSADDLRVLETIAGQISVSIQNARLLEAERVARTHAEIIARANAALAQSLDLETVLAAFLENLRLLVPYNSANVRLFDGVSSFHTLAQHGYENWTKARPATMNISQSFSHLAALIKNRASELIPDTERDPRWERIAGFEYIRSWLGVPLLAGGEVIGFYSMDHNTPDFFTAEHVHLAETLSAQAAVAIHNVRLLEETRLSRDRLAELSRKLVEAHENESRSIGRELHDQIGQILTALKLTLEIAQQLPPEQRKNKQAQAQELVDELLVRVSRLTLDLRPPMLDDLGLLPALLWHINHYQEQTGIEVEFVHGGVGGRRFSLQIADRLSLSARTVEMHRGNLLKKLGLNSQTELVKFAAKRGLVE